MPIDLPVEEQIDSIRDQAVIVDCNDVLARNYGYSDAAEIIGRGLEAFWGRERELSDAILRRLIENGYTLQGETEERLPNLEIRWFLNWITGVIQDGHLVHIWGSQIDITERKQAEKELRESEERFRVLGAATFEGIVLSDGRLLECNQRMAEMAGYDLSEVIGMEVMDHSP